MLVPLTIMEKKQTNKQTKNTLIWVGRKEWAGQIFEMSYVEIIIPLLYHFDIIPLKTVGGWFYFNCGEGVLWRKKYIISILTLPR